MEYQKIVYVIARVVEGGIKLDSSGLNVYATFELAQEDLRRFIFSTGYKVLPLPVATAPTLLGTKEQRQAWDASQKQNKEEN